MPEVISILVGPLEANCLIIFCEETKEALVVDPGDEGSKIIAAIKNKAIMLKYIAIFFVVKTSLIDSIRFKPMPASLYID